MRDNPVFILITILQASIFILLILCFIILCINKIMQKKKHKNKKRVKDNNDQITLNDRDKLYSFFIFFSAIVCLLVPFLVDKLTQKFPYSYAKNEAGVDHITIGLAHSISLTVWPILIAYIIVVIGLLLKKTNYRKVYYPLSLITTIFILRNLAIIYKGYLTSLTFFVFLLIPLIVQIIIAIITGIIQDVNKDNKIIYTLTTSIFILLLSSIIIPFSCSIYNMYKKSNKNKDFVITSTFDEETTINNLIEGNIEQNKSIN